MSLIKASEALPLASSSNSFPVRTIVMIAAAVSKKTSVSSKCRGNDVIMLL
jgi:hypothetical protein